MTDARGHHHTVSAESGCEVEPSQVGVFTDQGIVVGGHLVQPRPPFEELHALEGGHAGDHRVPELGRPPRHVAREVLARRFVWIGAGDDDPVAVVRSVRILMSPVNTGRVDNNGKAVRPPPRQDAAKELLTDRANRHLDLDQCSHHRRVGPRGDHDGLGGNLGPRGQPDRLQGPRAPADRRNRVGDITCPGLGGSALQACEDGARVRIPVLGAEYPEPDVIEYQVGHQPTNLVDLEPCDVRAELPLTVDARLEPCFVGGVDQKQIPPLAEVRAAAVQVTEFRVEPAVERDAVLGQLNIRS